MRATPGGDAHLPADRPAINDDLDFQHSVWRFERIGWVVMALIVFGALFGAAGSGPLSSTEVSGESIRVEYERFHRHLAPSDITVHIDKAVARGETITLVLSRGFVDKFEINAVVPEPDEWRVADDGMHLRFRTAGLERSGTVHFYLKPQRRGPVSVAIGVQGETPVELRQFIYP